MKQALPLLTLLFLTPPLNSAPKCDTDILAELSYKTQQTGKPESWDEDGPKAANSVYEAEFRNILSQIGVTSTKDYFENFLHRRRILKQSTHVLDLFGSCFFVQNQSLDDSLTGLRLHPYDPSKLSDYQYPPEKVPEQVLADIFSPEAWEKLDRSLARRSAPALDLITMRPEGGWRHLDLATPKQQINALRFILNNVRRRLSPTGHFYFRIPITDFPMMEHPLLTELRNEIEAETPYKLVLSYEMKPDGRDYLDGALIPKRD